MREPVYQSGWSLFQVYTQSACIYECRVKRAHAKAGCIGWEHPHLVLADGSFTKVCDRTNRGVFSDAYRSSEGVGGCGCLADCEKVSYSYSTSQVPFDLDHMCSLDDRVRCKQVRAES